MSDTFVPIRIVISNPTGQNLRIQKFIEITNPTTGDIIYSALDASDSLATTASRHASSTSGLSNFSVPASAAGTAGLLHLSPHLQPSTAAASLQTANATLSQFLVSSQRGFNYDGFPVSSPHPLAGPLDEKRAMAASLSTIYIYDFIVGL